MKAQLIALLLATPLAIASAEETKLRDISWTELSGAGQLRGGNVINSPEGGAMLKVEPPAGASGNVAVASVAQPNITAGLYSISGEVRYEGMEGDGYLEMWSHFGPSEAYFSRTLGESGPMAKLSGSSGWRPFVLPFNRTDKKSTPTSLDLDVHFAGKGTVFLRNTRLVEGGTLSAAVTPPNAWWSAQTAGLIGGCAGALLGCLGSLMEWLVSRGRAPRFVVTTVRILIGVGIIVTVVGLYAVVQKQPYAVWFALLLLGVLSLAIFPFRLRRYEGHFRDIELRRMSSMDAAVR